MDVSPKTLREVEFREKMRGYHPEDVDQFLERVAAGIEVLQDRLRQAVERAQRAEQAATEVGGADETLKRTLVLAQRTADMAVQEGREHAARLVANAEQQAQGMIAEAESQARAAHEEELNRARNELTRLEKARDQAGGEVDGLTRWVTEHRAHLLSALQEATASVEKANFLSPPPPTQRLEATGYGYSGAPGVGASGVAGAAAPPYSPPAPTPPSPPTPDFSGQGPSPVPAPTAEAERPGPVAPRGPGPAAPPPGGPPQGGPGAPPPAQIDLSEPASVPVAAGAPRPAAGPDRGPYGTTRPSGEPPRGPGAKLAEPAPAPVPAPPRPAPTPQDAVPAANDNDAYFADLRQAVSGEQPLAPREDDYPPVVDQRTDDFYDQDFADARRFGGRLRRRR